MSASNSFAAVAATKKCWIIDLDGVVYRGKEAVPGAKEAIDRLRQSDRRVVFLTNDSRRSRDELVTRLAGLGIETVSEDVFTSGSIASRYLKDHGAAKNGAFVIGGAGLREELGLCGIKEAPAAIADALVIGLAPDFSYAIMAEALTAARRQILMIACNRDPNYPIENGGLMPGCGAVVAAIEAAAERPIDVEAGKPNPFCLEVMLATLRFAKDECIIVGDSLYSDIELARRTGTTSVYLRAGFPPKPVWDDGVKTFVCDSLRGVWG